MARDWYEEALDKAEKGKLGGTLRESRPEGVPVPRPNMRSTDTNMYEMGDRKDMPKPKSYAPAGMANQVKGDIGYYRGMEADRAFKRPIKRAGKVPTNPLRYRKPETAIDAKFGPGDKAC